MYSNRFKRHMQIACRKLVAFWFLFSRWNSVFVYSRSFYLFLDEKLFLIQYKRCIDTRFSKCLSQKFAAFTLIVWLIQLSRSPWTFWICWNYLLTRENSETFYLCGSYQAKITQVTTRSFFKCEKFLSLLNLLVFFTDILKSCDRKCGRKCHRSIKEKGSITKDKSLFTVGGFEISLENFRLEKMARLFATRIQWPK